MERFLEKLWSLVERALRKFADDLVTLIARTKRIVFLAALIAGILFIAGVATWHSNWVNSAGIIFDICGALQLFVKEEWRGLTETYVELYGDIEKYPYGPPSHVTRVLSEHDERNEVNFPETGLGPHYFNNLGVLLLVIGFALQLTSNFM
jgi:hypothetical protein